MKSKVEVICLGNGPLRCKYCRMGFKVFLRSCNPNSPAHTHLIPKKKKTNKKKQIVIC